MLNDQSIFITGATGSFGKAFEINVLNEVGDSASAQTCCHDIHGTYRTAVHVSGCTTCTRRALRAR